MSERQRKSERKQDAVVPKGARCESPATAPLILLPFRLGSACVRAKRKSRHKRPKKGGAGAHGKGKGKGEVEGEAERHSRVTFDRAELALKADM